MKKYIDIIVPGLLVISNYNRRRKKGKGKLGHE